MFDDHGPLASPTRPLSGQHPPPARPGPLPAEPCGVRTAVLAFLAGGPRRTGDIAAHLGRSKALTTTHLKKLHRRGLVVRVGRATYARADLAPSPSHPGVAPFPQQVRACILARLADGPCRARQLAGQLGLAPSTTTCYLVALHRRGLVVRLSRGLYACSDHEHPAPSPDAAAHVPLIRDAILDFLADGPRQAEQVAAHVDRPTANATGHLAAMRRRGLVVRLGWGVYARADLVAAAHVPAVVTRGHPVRDQVLACLSTKETRSHNDVACRADREPDRVLDHLRALVRAGLAQEVAPKCFRRSSPAPAPAASPPA